MSRRSIFAALVTGLLSAALPVAAQTQSEYPTPTQSGNGEVLSRPSLEACSSVAEQDLRNATAGLATLPPDEAKRRLNRAQVRLRRSAGVQAMLSCLMSRTK